LSKLVILTPVHEKQLFSPATSGICMLNKENKHKASSSLVKATVKITNLLEWKLKAITTLWVCM